MNESIEDKWLTKKISRRDMLKLTGVGAVGVAIGASGFGGAMKAMGVDVFQNSVTQNTIPFYGKHQSGITTPVQTHIYFLALNVLVSSKRELQQLFQTWTPMMERLMEGQPIADSTSNSHIPPVDTGESAGLHAANLTITVGVGPSLFEKKQLDLAHHKPNELRDLPHFPKDQLDPAYTGGDLCIQACADDPQVAFHAVRNLVRAATGKVEVKWSQSGFNSFPEQGGTPRNLFSFKDGTVNPVDKDMDDVVWVQVGDSKSWLTNGSYLVVRRIQMHLETWDRTSLKDQEETFGRHRDSGAPIGMKNEFDSVDIHAKDLSGQSVIPENSHVYLSKKANARILRRAFSYASGIIDETGAHDAGLLFISFQKHPDQFTKIQNSLGRLDRLNEYITHRGSAVFACFPGVQKGGYIGETLFDVL